MDFKTKMTNDHDRIKTHFRNVCKCIKIQKLNSLLSQYMPPRQQLHISFFFVGKSFCFSGFGQFIPYFLTELFKLH